MVQAIRCACSQSTTVSIDGFNHKSGGHCLAKPEAPAHCNCCAVARGRQPATTAALPGVAPSSLGPWPAWHGKVWGPGNGRGSPIGMETAINPPPVLFCFVLWLAHNCLVLVWPHWWLVGPMEAINCPVTVIPIPSILETPNVTNNSYFERTNQFTELKMMYVCNGF